MALSGTASAAGSGAVSNDPNPPITGTIAGFSNGDFAYLDALNVGSLSLAQLSLAQSGAGVSNGTLQTVNSLGEKLLTTKSATGHNAFGRAAGVSLNLGQGSATVPQVQLTQAETVSPPPNQVKTSRILTCACAGCDCGRSAEHRDGQHAVQQRLLRPRSEPPAFRGQATIANAEVLPVTKAMAVLAVDGTVQNNSLEELAPNAHGNLGLSSSDCSTPPRSSCSRIPGATIDIKSSPLVLQAFAGGDNSSFVTYGSGDHSRTCSRSPLAARPSR